MTPQLDLRQAILLLLKKGPLTRPEITARLPTSATTVQRIIAQLHAGGRVHVVGWKRAIGTRGRLAPRFVAGRGDDAPRPPPDPTAEMRRYRDKNRLLINLRRGVYRAKKRGAVPVAAWVQQMLLGTK